MPQLSTITPKTLANGIEGRYVHGQTTTLGLVRLTAGSTVPLHQHPQEQITYILEGQLHMVIDGEDCLLEPGMFYIISANIVHSAVALTDCVVVDVFSPVREDYK